MDKGVRESLERAAKDAKKTKDRTTDKSKDETPEAETKKTDPEAPAQDK